MAGGHAYLVTEVISNFNDLHVGDLAFLAVAIGMNDSAGAHCVHCFAMARQFGHKLAPQNMRTKASLTESLNDLHALRLRKQARNVRGVNNVGLMDIDPQRITVPVLHCPMGLVDKVLTVFKEWTIFECELLPLEAGTTREAQHVALANLKAAQTTLLHEQQGAAKTKASATQAKEARIIAKDLEKKIRDAYEEMAKRHCAKLQSLSQDFDVTFRANNINKEHCHGGKCNGVNCIRIVDKAQALWAEFKALHKQKKLA